MALSFSDMFLLTDVNVGKEINKKEILIKKKKIFPKIIMGKKKVLTMRIELMTFST